MKHACCPDCRLRFTGAAAAYLPSCPTCGGELHKQLPHELIGFRLCQADAALSSLAQAVAVQINNPDDTGRLS